MPVSIFITNFKGMFVSRIIFLTCLLATGVLTAQSTRISGFNIDLIDGNKVIVRWTMNAGSTCRTLEVERSFDRKSFNSVYEYPGICGDSAKEATYTWLDDQLNASGKYYYRVRLAEGEYTLLDSIEFKKINLEQLIFASPNPSSGVFQITVQKKQTETYDWELYSPTGNLLQQQQNLAEPLFLLDLAVFNSGVYILKVRLESGEEGDAYLSLVR